MSRSQKEKKSKRDKVKKRKSQKVKKRKSQKVKNSKREKEIFKGMILSEVILVSLLVTHTRHAPDHVAHTHQACT